MNQNHRFKNTKTPDVVFHAYARTGKKKLVSKKRERKKYNKIQKNQKNTVKILK